MSVADYKLLSLSKILKKNNTINTTTFNKTILSARRHWSRHALDFGASVYSRALLGPWQDWTRVVVLAGGLLWRLAVSRASNH